jgi:hypothetical protein
MISGVAGVSCPPDRCGRREVSRFSVVVKPVLGSCGDAGLTSVPVARKVDAESWVLLEVAAYNSHLNERLELSPQVMHRSSALQPTS